MFDKTKTCKDCPDRTIGPPGCHSYCKEYLERIAKDREIKEKIRKEKKAWNDFNEVRHYRFRGK